MRLPIGKLTTLEDKKEKLKKVFESVYSRYLGVYFFLRLPRGNLKGKSLDEDNFVYAY